MRTATGLKPVFGGKCALRGGRSFNAPYRPNMQHTPSESSPAHSAAALVSLLSY